MRAETVVDKGQKTEILPSTPNDVTLVNEVQLAHEHQRLMWLVWVTRIVKLKWKMLLLKLQVSWHLRVEVESGVRANRKMFINITRMIMI